jgi:hypothetical protein
MANYMLPHPPSPSPRRRHTDGGRTRIDGHAVRTDGVKIDVIKIQMERRVNGANLRESR